MGPQSQPCIGTWYAGEGASGAFEVIDQDAFVGVVHLRATDGRRVRMSLERWSRQPLAPADERAQG